MFEDQPNADNLPATFPELDRFSGSWVVTSPSGKTTLETYSRHNALVYFHAHWTVQRAGDYLAEQNRRIATQN